MGWMTPAEQKETLKFYGKWAEVVCNYCQKPIFQGDLYVIDSKGGFYKVPEAFNRTNGFVGCNRFPKVTYHRVCDAMKRGKPVPKAVMLQSNSNSKTQGEMTMAKVAKSAKEEVVTKKLTKKAVEPKAEKKAKAAASNGGGKLFGKFREGSAIGNMVAELVEKGKATEKTLEKLADGAALAGRLFWIRKHGKDSGFYSFFRSQKTDGLWIMKVKNQKAYKSA